MVKAERSAGSQNSRTKVLSVLLFLAAPLLPVWAQDFPDDVGVFNEEGVADWAKTAFFHVSVNGKLDKIPSEDATRQGKAFAIAPNLLVTSQHIVGDPGEWLRKTNKTDHIDLAVERAARPLVRQVQITRAEGTGSDSDFANPMILPVSPYPIDTAAISFSSLRLKRYFQLSMCGIQEGQNYTALMTNSQKPADPRSIDSQEPVQLIAVGTDPKNYESLYIFDLKPGSLLEGELEGHDGSPIFDSEDNVVAVVSAVIVISGGKHRILATPIQPIFPGASTLAALGPDIAGHFDTNMKCSLFDTVKRIKNEVSAHAIWTVEVEPPDVGDTFAKIRLSYENVEETPNIESVEVTYYFWGKDQDGQENIEKIRDYDDPHKNKIVLYPNLDDSRPREFLTDEIIRIGKQLVMPHVKTARPEGFIQHVELKIIPTLSKQSGGRILDKRPIVRDFPWSLTERRALAASK
ncbi:hypothetical protein ASE60_22810 [Ensifer sp. Root278]|nr:hypothetical protein ASE60_22810 [Ensifer sp. Root278]